MPQQDDLGFIAPETLAPVEETPAEDPFQKLEAPAEDEEQELTPEELEAEAQTYGSLEEEYRVLASLKKRRDQLKAQHSVASAEYEAHRGRMMRAMRHQGTRQFRSTTVQRGSCHFNSGYSVRIKDPSVFIPWAKKKAAELLTVHAQTLTKHVREQYRDRGVPPTDDSFPPGLEVTEHDTLTVTVPKEE